MDHCQSLQTRSLSRCLQEPIGHPLAMTSDPWNIRWAAPSDDMYVIVMFLDFSIKKYNVRRMYKNNPWYISLESIPTVFNRAHADSSQSIVFNSQFSVSAKDCWKFGESIENKRTIKENMDFCRKMWREEKARRFECRKEELMLRKPVLLKKFKEQYSGEMPCLDAQSARYIEQGLECCTHQVVKNDKNEYSYDYMNSSEKPNGWNKDFKDLYDYCEYCKDNL